MIEREFVNRFYLVGLNVGCEDFSLKLKDILETFSYVFRLHLYLNHMNWGTLIQML